jgi:hypothetical protein
MFKHFSDEDAFCLGEMLFPVVGEVDVNIHGTFFGRSR